MDGDDLIVLLLAMLVLPVLLAVGLVVAVLYLLGIIARDLARILGLAGPDRTL